MPKVTKLPWLNQESKKVVSHVSALVSVCEVP